MKIQILDEAWHLSSRLHIGKLVISTFYQRNHLNMKTELNRFFGSFIIGIIFLSGCAGPQHFWPQKDIVESNVNNIPGQHTVLIASRASEYKKQLVAELQQQLSAAHISYITIGIKQLEKVESTDYAAVVVINKCLGWGLDHEVIAFLESQKATSNIILHTTSGGGAWLPEKLGRDFDAISGASVKANVSDVTRYLMESIQKRL